MTRLECFETISSPVLWLAVVFNRLIWSISLFTWQLQGLARFILLLRLETWKWSSALLKYQVWSNLHPSFPCDVLTLHFFFFLSYTFFLSTGLSLWWSCQGEEILRFTQSSYLGKTFSKRLLCGNDLDEKSLWTSLCSLWNLLWCFMLS